jgi:hypothetical protein
MQSGNRGSTTLCEIRLSTGVLAARRLIERRRSKASDANGTDLVEVWLTHAEPVLSSSKERMSPGSGTAEANFRPWFDKLTTNGS